MAIFRGETEGRILQLVYTVKLKDANRSGKYTILLFFHLFVINSILTDH